MRILCLDIPAPGASLDKYAPHLNAEALHAWGLYKSGFIRDIYFRQDILDVNYLGRYASTTLAAFELFLS